jgi:rubrerythrin
MESMGAKNFQLLGQSESDGVLIWTCIDCGIALITDLTEDPEPRCPKCAVDEGTHHEQTHICR